MNLSDSPAQRTSPSPFGWILALTSGVLLFGGLWHFVNTLLEYRRDTARKELIQSVGDRDIGKIRSRIQHALGSWGALSVTLDRLQSRTDSFQDTLTAMALEHCVNALEALARNDASLAQRSVQNLSDPKFDSLATNFSSSSDATWETMRSAIQKAALDFKKASNSLEQERLAINDAERSLSEVENEYFLVGNDLSDLLGATLERKRDSDSPEFPFYREGVLAFLPSIKGVPDGLEDLSELKKSLEAINATVREGNSNDPHSEFMSRLSALTAQGRSIYARAATRSAVVIRLRESEKNLRSALLEKREILRRAISGLISALVT